MRKLQKKSLVKRKPVFGHGLNDSLYQTHLKVGGIMSTLKQKSPCTAMEGRTGAFREPSQHW